METYNRLYDNFPVWFGWKGMTGLEPMGETEMGVGAGWRGEKGRGTVYHALFLNTEESGPSFLLALNS